MNNEVRTGMYTYKGKDITFSFYTNLPAVKKMMFVKNITSNVVNNDYNSIIRDLLFDFEIIEMFTDIKVLNNEEYDDYISEIENFLFETNVVDIVKANMTEGLLQELNNAVDDNIAYRTGIQRNNLSDALSNLLVTFNKKINNIDTESLMKVAQKLNNMTGDLSADSILEAYVNSDLYKKETEKTQQRRNKQQDFIENVVKNEKR